MKKFKSQPSAYSFLGLTRLEEYQERGTTINSASYSEMLNDRLQTAIQSKCSGLLSKGVLLLHDNACPHC
jgi:hypothetical protein